MRRTLFALCFTILMTGVVLQPGILHSQDVRVAVADTVQPPASLTSTAYSTVSQTEQPTMTFPPISTTGWNRYVNSPFAFSIDYPPTMQAETPIADNGSYDPMYPCRQYNLSYISPAQEIICFTLAKGTYPETTNNNYIGASLAVIFTNLPQQHCTFMDDVYLKVSQIDLGGHHFYFRERGGAAAGLLGHFITYLTYVGNECLEFDAVISSENIGMYLQTPAIPFYEDRLRAVYNAMLASFIFSPAQASLTPATPINTAHWATYADADYGLSLAYPTTMQTLGSETFFGENNTDIPMCNSDYISANYFTTGTPHLVQCFYLSNNTYPDTTGNDFINASLSISTFDLSQQACVSFQDIPSRLLNQFVINGMVFTSFETYRQSEIRRRFDVHNRTYVHDTCFDLTTTIAVDYNLGNGTRFTESNRRNIQAIFDQMIVTMRFFSPSQPVTVKPMDRLPVANSQGWHAYTNSDYGFSIAVPGDLNEINAKNGDVNNAPSICSNVSSEAHLVVCFTTPKDTYSATATTIRSVTLAITVYDANGQNCFSSTDVYIEGNPEWLKLGAINGLNFAAVSRIDSENGFHQRYYYTYIHDTCLAITMDIETNPDYQSANASYPITYFMDSELLPVQSILNQMVLTFRATDTH